MSKIFFYIYCVYDFLCTAIITVILVKVLLAFSLGEVKTTKEKQENESGQNYNKYCIGIKND